MPTRPVFTSEWESERVSVSGRAGMKKQTTPVIQKFKKSSFLPLFLLLSPRSDSPGSDDSLMRTGVATARGPGGGQWAMLSRYCSGETLLRV